MRSGLLALFRRTAGIRNPGGPIVETFAAHLPPLCDIFVVRKVAVLTIEPLALGGDNVRVEFPSYQPDPLRITRQECDFGRWEMASRGPHPQLRDYVIGYVGLQSAMRLNRERHLPSG